MATSKTKTPTIVRAIRSLHRSTLPAAAAFCLCLLPVPAGAQNLIVNPAFDHDTGGWGLLYPGTPEGREIHFVSTLGSDLPGGSGPGAIEVRNFNTQHFNGGDSLVAYQDVDVQGAGSYWCSAAMFRPAIHNEAARMGVFVQWLDASQSVLSQDLVRPTSYPTDTWIAATASLHAPPTAQTARVLLSVGLPSNSGATDPALIYYDDLIFQDLTTTHSTQELFIPAAASTHGFNNTFWTTTGWFVNAVGVPVDLYAGFLHQGHANQAAVEGVLFIGTIPPHGFLTIDDLAAEIGGAGLSGGIYVLASAQGGGVPSILVTATTYTSTPNPDGGGSFGQGLPAVPAGTETSVTVPGLFQSASHRTNIGAVNTSGSTVTLSIEVFSSDGQLVAGTQWTLGAYEQVQVPVTAMGVGNASGGYVTFTRISSAGSFRAYASVVDQESGDSVYTPGT